MDNKKIKRIIIKEGLIFLGLVVIPLVISCMWWLGQGIWIIGWVSFTYPLYLIICFILWAIRRLKEK